MKSIRNLLIILISTLLLTSCATVLHERSYVLNIRSDEAQAKVKVYDSIYNLPLYTEVKRSDEDLVLTLMSENKNIEFKAKPRPTNTFKFANLIGLPLVYPALICYGIDLTNNKRFHYGRSILLNTKDTTVTIVHSKKDPNKPTFAERHPKRKGEFDLHISLPFVNTFLSQPVGETVHSSTGLRGISMGLDYYHRKDQFLNLSASYITDYAFLITEPNDIYEYGSPERNYNTSINLSNNHKIKRFSLGYGFSYSKKEWVPGTGTQATNTATAQKYNTLGLVFPAYFQLGKSFNLGVIYLPTFYRFTSTDQYVYEHLISLDFAWKIKL